MPPIDWNAVFQVAPNIVTAVIFGFFVLKLLERQDKRDEKRDAQDEKRDAEWRNFLALGRDQYVESVATVSTEMKSLAAAVMTTHTAVVTLDAWSRAEAIRADAVRTATAAATAAEVVRVAAEVASREAARIVADRDRKS